MEPDQECIIISSDSEDEDPLLTTKRRPGGGRRDQPAATPSTSTGHVPSARTPPVGNVSAVLTYQDESKLPAYYNEDIIPDPETGLNLPVRILDYFYFCDAVQFVPVPLEHLDRAALLGYGLALLPPEKKADIAAGAATSTAIVFEVDEWSIEYGSPPLLWLKSKRAWYKLLQPKPSYKHYFSTIQRKFEVCTGIYNLMEADKKVSYADVVAHMHARYGITEDYVVKEAASVLKGLLEAYPEYRTTPFFLKLRDVLTAKSSSVTPKSPRKEKDVARARASDSPSSTSIRRRRRLCHQCKKELSSTATDHQKCGDCRKFYCADCLDKYGIKLSTVKGTPWVCLACEGLCTCKACLKSKAGDGASNGRKRKSSAADSEELRKKEEKKRRRLAREAEEARKKEELKRKQARLAALRARYPMDDRELLAELLELGELTVPQHPPKGQTVSTEFVPMEAWADFMMVWSFVDTFHKYIGVKRRTIELMQRAFAQYPEVQDLHYVSELHKKLLSILVKDKAKANDEEEQEDSQEDAAADVLPDEVQPAERPFTYFSETLPINSATWPEVLLQYVERHDLADVFQPNRQITVASPQTKRDGRHEQTSKKATETKASDTIMVIDSEEGSEPPKDQTPAAVASADHAVVAQSSEPATSTASSQEEEGQDARLSSQPVPRSVLDVLRSEDYLQLSAAERLEVLRFLIDEVLQTDSFWHYQDDQKEKLLALKTEQWKEKRDKKGAKRIPPNKDQAGKKEKGKESAPTDPKEREREEKERRRQEQLQAQEKRVELAGQRDLLNLQAVMRAQPLGYDRYGNRYWWIREPLAPGKQVGRIFVEQTPNEGGYCSHVEVPHWSFYETKEDLARLMQYLNVNGIREKALDAELKRYYDNILLTIPYADARDKEEKQKEREERQRLAEVRRNRFMRSSAEPSEEKEEEEEEKEEEENEEEIGQPADKHDEGSKDNGGDASEAKEAGSKKQDLMDVVKPLQRLVSLEKIREQILDLEDRIPYQLLLNRVAYAKKRPAWRKTVETEHSPAVLCELLLFLEAQMIGKAMKKDWHNSTRQTRWRRFCRDSVATSLSQVALVLAVFEGAIQWQQAKQSEKCQICRRSTQPGCMLLCDGCDRGFHTFCLNPRLKSVPSGEWYCKSCLANSKSACEVCEGGGRLLCCEVCPRVYHLKCLDPPLKQVPKEKWTCPQHEPRPVTLRRSKRHAVGDDDDDDDEEDEEDKSEEEEEENKEERKRRGKRKEEEEDEDEEKNESEEEHQRSKKKKTGGGEKEAARKKEEDDDEAEVNEDGESGEEVAQPATPKQPGRTATRKKLKRQAAASTPTEGDSLKKRAM